MPDGEPWQAPELQPALLKAADMAVLPSFKEGFSNALIEAMAAGLPCVVTPVGECPILVTAGENGFVAPVGDDGRLAEVLRLLVSDPAMRRRMGDASRKRVARVGDAEQAAARVQQVYLDLLK